MRSQILHGDCRDVLKDFPENYFDSCCTDPPYELGFMGKGWDSRGIAYNVELWLEVFRVLKPGAHLVAFGGTRTYHRMTCAIEDAGFEIRDSLHWIYSTGFPKSLNVSKAIDKAAGAEREIVSRPRTAVGVFAHSGTGTPQDISKYADAYAITKPATPEADYWDGWGTALSPSHEPIVLARKPFPRSVASNVLKHGTGAVNIEATRVGDAGRWSPNVLYSHSQDCNGECAPDCPVAELERQKHEASRFYPCFRYQGKAPQRERPQGEAEHVTVKPLELIRWLVRLVTPLEGLVLDHFAGTGTTGEACSKEGMSYVLIEKEADYIPLIHDRLSQPSLFEEL